MRDSELLVADERSQDTLGRTYTSIYADFAEPIGSHAAGIDNAGFTIYRCYRMLMDVYDFLAKGPGSSQRSSQKQLKIWTQLDFKLA